MGLVMSAQVIVFPSRTAELPCDVEAVLGERDARESIRMLSRGVLADLRELAKFPEFLDPDQVQQIAMLALGIHRVVCK
jgi:hypothetical protein